MGSLLSFLRVVTVAVVLAGMPLLCCAANADVVDRAKDVLAIWQAQPQVKMPLMGCERCADAYDTIQALDAKGGPLASELDGSLRKTGTGFSESQLQRMQSVTENLEAVIMERKSQVFQYDKMTAEYRMLKSRPDDKKAREEHLYENPMRVR